MKEVVEEGIGVLTGERRMRVSLTDCSIERLELMLLEIDREAVKLKSELDDAEAEVRRLYGTADNVHLEYEAGEYSFPLDRRKEQLIELRDRIQQLFEKRKPVLRAYEEKYLLQRQVRILGSETAVKAKDRFIFFLILLVLSLLGIEAGKLGASGDGAVLRANVSDGAITSVDVIAGGDGYQTASVIPSDPSSSAGRGAEIVLEVAEGAVKSAKVIGGGKGYREDSLQLLVRPGLSSEVSNAFWLVDFICCLIFLSNFFFELKLARSKKWYWQTRWVDFITSIPLPPAQILASLGLSGSEALRAGRLLRVIRVLRALRALRLFLFMWRGLDHLAEVFDVRLMKKSFVAGLIVLAFGALLITLFGEKGEGHEAVEGFFPGLWWSFTTLVTGGFGDIYNPQTLPGRLLTVFLVVAGMVLVGVFTATLTTVLVGREEREQTAKQNEILNRIEAEGERVNQAIAKLERQQEDIARRLDER